MKYVVTLNTGRKKSYRMPKTINYATVALEKKVYAKIIFIYVSLQ